MSNETLFFILGLALVVIALVLSFAGMRFKNFPGSNGLLVGVTALVAVLVVATSVFAWRNGEDEQAHKAAELAEAAEHNEEAGDTVEAEEEQGPDTETTVTTASTAEGAELFNSQGCSGCHTLADAGSSGTTGPDLDGALQGDSPEFIKTSIIDPNDEIAQDYPPDVMPQSYETQMTPEELDALVQYLVEATGGSSN
jgi:mono/diheme cytochrome c family protein